MRSVALAWSLALLAATGGCEDDPPATTGIVATTHVASSASAAPSAAPKACSQAALKKELDGYCSVGVASGPPNMVPLPWSVKPGDRPPQAVEIYLPDNKQINVDGSITNKNAFASVWQRVAKLRKSYDQTAREGVPWLLAISPNVRMDVVASVMQSLVDSGNKRGHLVFSAKPGTLQTVKPRDPELLARIDQRIDSPDESERAMRLAKTIQTSKLVTCPAMLKVFGAVSTVPAERKCELLAVGVAEAFPTCECRHADEVLTMLYAVMADTKPPTRRGAWVPVALSTAAKPVTLAGKAPWSGFVSQLDVGRLDALNVQITTEGSP